MNPEMTVDLAEFECGCYIRVSPERSIALWQCPAGDSCSGWRLILAELARCMAQLRIHAWARSL